MNVLVVGGGGREHALGWALARSPRAPHLHFAPGNAGTARLGTNHAAASDDVEALVALAQDLRADLVIVGPEAPLVAGLADRLREAGVPVVGPSAYAAQLEGSKAFAKAFMQRYAIPTAAHRTFRASEAAEAEAYLRDAFAAGRPVVVKASGLAAGKGVVVADSADEAAAALHAAFGGAFGAAGDEVVLEERLVGEEASVFALCDGTTYVVLPPAQDHKRALDGDAGPNTGGMGAYAPAPVVTGQLLTEVCRAVVEPTLMGMQAEGHPFTGVLFVGLMLTASGPKVIEYNVRFGDPETQALMPLLPTTTVLELFEAMAHGRLGTVRLRTDESHAATVVLAAPGYPGPYPKGLPVSGLDEAEAVAGATVFHAGTAIGPDGSVVTDGGRVFAVTGVGSSLPEALERAYRAADLVRFDGKHLRRDIGHRALGRA